MLLTLYSFVHTGRGCREKWPRKKSPPEKSPQENWPPENYPPEIRKIVLQFFIFKLFIVTSSRDVSRTPAGSITHFLNVTKSSCLDAARVTYLPLSLLGEVFRRYLAVRYIAQLVAQGKTAKIAKPLLCKQLHEKIMQTYRINKFII